MKKVDAEKHRLCYVNGNIMYFTDNFAKQWGDDWDDAPYEHNADPPYERDPSLPAEVNRSRGHIVIGAWFDKRYRIGLPRDGALNSEYSVESINKGVVPWLSLYDEKGLVGGATVAETRKWCKKHGVCFALFEEEEKL